MAFPGRLGSSARSAVVFSHSESIESTVANADLVFIAILVKFGDGKRAEGREGHEATIDIEDTLKQEVFTIEPYRRLQVYIPRPASVLADWKKRSCRLLVAYNEYSPRETTVIELVPDRLEVLTADFKLLRDPDAVIKSARETARRLPTAVKRIHTFGLKVPREAIPGTEWEKYYATGGHLVLNVPVDQRLEKRAHDYIRSEDYQKREEGARALRHFKSDDNIARVTRLLNDPGWAYLRHAQENNGVEVRIYGVRLEAYQTLTAWGIDVGKPLTREEVRK